jgi:diacylglycerol O-acyltransferase
VSPSSASKLRGRRGGASDLDAGADDVLCYMDQGSFVGLRALGRGPALHLTWLYPHAIDEAAVRELSERLARGLLGVSCSVHHCHGDGTGGWPTLCRAR